MSDLFMNMHQRRLSSAGVARAMSPSTVGADDPLADILRLQLKKPKHWKWELSTSRSCSNIALPRIMLYDHRGELLVDANGQAEAVYQQHQPEPERTTTTTPTTPSSSTTPASRYAGSSARKRGSHRAATTNLTHSIRRALDREFSGLQIDDDDDDMRSRLGTLSPDSGNVINFCSNELPNECRSKSRSNSQSLKVRFKEDDAVVAAGAAAVVDLPTPPSTTNTTTSSSGPREKRRYRRSHSSGGTPTGTPSILERFSYTKGRLSSPEYMEELAVQHGPRYFLRSSKAGTLVVQEDSFSRLANCRRRRRTKNSSTESVAATKYQSTNSLTAAKLQVPMPQTFESGEKSASLQNVTEAVETTRRRKLQPVRRYRSDGNVLLHKHISSSDEEPLTAAPRRREPHRGKQKMHNGVNLVKDNDECANYHQPCRRRF